jgi:hypothetical protein
VAQESKSIAQVASELKELTISYAKQETVDPIKGLGRFVAFGFAGSLLLAIGLILLALAGLRAMQTETGDLLDGSMSWAPYLIATVVLAILAVVAIAAINKDAKS